MRVPVPAMLCNQRLAVLSLVVSISINTFFRAIFSPDLKEPRISDLVASLLFTPRRIWLLFASIGLAAAVAGTGMLLGILVVSYLWQVSRKILALTLLLLLALAAVPPYIHALTWSSLLYSLTVFLPGLTVTGWWISYWVELVAFLPLAILLSWIAIASVDPVLLGAGRVFSPDSETFTRILLPLATPALGAAFGFLFLV